MLNKIFLCSAILATTFQTPIESAAVKFSSAAKYRLLPSNDNSKVTIEARIYCDDPGWVYSEVVKALPESLIPFEYKGKILNYTPTEALFAGTELLNPEIVEKALELLGNDKKQLDIDAYIDTVERSLKTRLNKLNVLMTAGAALVGTATLLGSVFSYYLFTISQARAQAIGAHHVQIAVEQGHIFLNPEEAAQMQAQIQADVANMAQQLANEVPNWRITPWINRLNRLGNATFETFFPLFGTGMYCFWHNKKQVKTNATQITKALYNYPHRTSKNFEKTRASFVNIAKLAGDELLAEVLAETTA